MSHNPGYKPSAQAPNTGSSWSDHGIDQSEPKTPSAKLHAIAHDIARLEAEVQQAVALLERARSVQFATDGFPNDLDDAVVAFINKHKT